ncbi:MAG: hypothetical protein B6229_00020 [Spirochaetaceae bacterium 4572_7]|nr:MAG: hypothetical protein B6229_00020 [Spirochaetaceae bacterium 4572_7]
MNKISDLLTLDLNLDIKNVIDLEDRSENEIQQEIESYIITNGISEHLNNFINQYTSNIKETGAWLSGFYGSGKSYFGKMIGYIIDNKMINGTPARERFIPRLKGVPNASLIENAIRQLDSINSRVIFLDIAKQNTENGLAFTLFTNFLQNLGFSEGVYGYLEFDIYLDGKTEEFKKIVLETKGETWANIKKDNRKAAKAMRSAHLSMGYTNENYTEALDLYNASISSFSANALKEQLQKYLDFNNDETVVFVLDEASEAISQKKFTLLDLEGISESLSSFAGKVWTIAIAQEKLDDVINNANVNKSQLTKVTDRFKTKLHLESTEVEVIIKSRLLHKTEAGFENLVEYYKQHEGLVSDATNLKSSFPTKTENADDFAKYYPFHKYQFDILQKFLFSSNALVATQIAARGMIITTFDVLRKQMKEQALYRFTTGYDICAEAQTAPPIGLVNKYDTAKKTLVEGNSKIDGIKLLKTIHLLHDSDVVAPTVENITKSYISDIKTYYEIKPLIEEALQLLISSKVLLLSNNNYKITSDIEAKLIDDMNLLDVDYHSRKRSLIVNLKNYKLFTSIGTLNDGSDNYKFSVVSDQDDELSAPGNKQLKLKVFSLYNISDDRQDFIENVKVETQYQKDLITLIPNNKEFTQIDKLIDEISRYLYLDEKKGTERDPEKRKIIDSFSIIREEKEKELRVKIDNAYRNASLIYMFDELLLNSDSFKGTISELQRKLVKNIYTKRLVSSLSEGLVSKLFTSRKENLDRLFSGDDFKFFDSNGNFTGDHLKIVEEINAKIKSRYVDGRSLESDLALAPWGYTFGTIVTTLAALFRAGRLSVKYNGDTWFSHEQIAVHDAFTNATKFRSASFKSIIATLSSIQKNSAVTLLMELKASEYINHKIDWTISDYDLADSTRSMAEHFIGLIDFEKKRDEDFETFFPIVSAKKEVLLGFGGKVTESNYIEKVEHLLINSTQFTEAIQTVIKAQKFIKKKFTNVKEFKNYIESVSSELKKADKENNSIIDAQDEFFRLYKLDMVKNFGAIQQQVQIVKDEYRKLILNAASGMSHEYKILAGKIDAVQRTLKQYPEDLNRVHQKKLNDLSIYCNARIIDEPLLDLSVTCINSGFSISDILNYIELVPNKENELLIIQSELVSEAPKSVPVINTDSGIPPAPKKPRKVLFSVSNKIMTVKEYKLLLTTQLSALAAANPNDEIELEIKQ